MRILVLVLCLFGVVIGNAQPNEAFEWVLGPDLTYASYEQNPDTESPDEMINLWFSDASGTRFYSTIDAEPTFFDYRISPYSGMLKDKEKILIESPQGLIFADRTGKHIKTTTYRTVQHLGEGEIYHGKTLDGRYQEVYDLEQDKVLFRVSTDDNYYIEWVGDYFKVSGYEKPTQIFDRNGKLILETEDSNIVVLDTDELRLFAQDFDKGTNQILDGSGRVLFDLPRNIFDAKAEENRIMVRLGAFKKYWVDLDGNKLTDPFSVPLIAGEIDLLYNCGTAYKMGAEFKNSGLTFPCEYDFVIVTPGDSTVIRAKKGNRTFYFDRKGEPLYDATSFNVTRYLGGNYFIGARSGKCEINHVDGRKIIQTDLYPSDPTQVAYASFVEDSRGGKLVVADKNGREMTVYDTSGTIIYTRKSEKMGLSWGGSGDYLKITEGAHTGMIDIDGNEVLPFKYRHLRTYFIDGVLKYLITTQIKREQVDIEKNGPMGLLDGVSSHLIDAQTGEVLVSGRTGLRWINEDHLLVYFGTTYGVARLRR